MSEPSLFAPAAPLAARLRPRTLDEVMGQPHLLAPGHALGDAIRRGDVGSVILWGPPGSGKTTLARVIAQHTSREFVTFSAVTEGVQRVREILRDAEERRRLGRETIFFCDEIHRFNRGQQDAFLPAVESGLITLIGATTENPSFELNAALLSRCRVYVLEPLTVADLEALLRRALADRDRGLGAMELRVADDAIAFLATAADGDARRALTALEAAGQQVGLGGEVSREVAADVFARRLPAYDKSGEGHYNLISALHKAVRGSDPQGALYWLARMIEGGEAPLYLARRLVRMAIEDIGLADPQALTIALAAKDAFDFLGAPEGELALAEAAVYLATAPKSNRVYAGWGAAREAARQTPAAAVPLHLRNAVTGLMKELHYGEGYRYAHDAPTAYLPQEYLPVEVAGARFYEPGPMGLEKRIAERMAWWAGQRGSGAGEQEEASAPHEKES
ncbi:MAG TPA: replication-associated recombination protein A [Gemmatimonadales bacterium]|nr:replication-associated recombination protein A [Gemmatimonadales bacterium]